MATTTNYGWTTPDDTALVKDGAAAIRTLGSSVDTTTKALNPETTLGDIAYRSSTANVKTRLGIGSTGQVLTVAGGVPAWAAPAGGGKVLQVVTATTTTSMSTTSTSLVDTNITASITPTADTSKILVMINAHTGAGNGSEVFVKSAVLRGSTTILDYFTSNRKTWRSPSGTYNMVQTYVYLDSPATTSSTTYKLQAAVANSSTAQYQEDGAMSTITLLEIGA